MGVSLSMICSLPISKLVDGFKAILNSSQFIVILPENYFEATPKIDRLKLFTFFKS
jgi:hypothetical protein